MSIFFHIFKFINNEYFIDKKIIESSKCSICSGLNKGGN